MCWLCDHPGATDEDYLDELRAIIRRFRWAVQFVESDQRPLAYTIGLHEMGRPELLVTGVNPQASARLLNAMVHDVMDRGTVLYPAMHIDYRGEFLLEVVKVDHPDVHLRWAVGLYGPDVRAHQLVWTDDGRRWPWDRGWAHGRRRQAVLGRRSSLAG